jgi:hypothetical protein
MMQRGIAAPDARDRARSFSAKSWKSVFRLTGVAG